MSATAEKPLRTPKVGGPRTFTTPQALYELPEWHAAVAALDAVTKAVQRGDVTQVQWVEAVDNAVRCLPYGDACQTCRSTTYPHAATIKGGWLNGQYWCATCEESVDFPMLV